MVTDAVRRHEKNLHPAVIARWLLILCCCLATLAGGAHAQITLPGPGIIITVAGDSGHGYSGDGGRATAESLSNPWGVAVDTNGNIFIADTANNRIRKVSASNWVISTVAGNGVACANPTASPACGDGGSAINAQLNGPRGVAVDSSGNIFIADTNDNRIREVSGTTITTVAGNGTAADTGDNGAATSAAVDAPGYVALDSSGNIYISDSQNEVVRKVNKSTSIISRFAGKTGNPGWSGDGGPATGAQLNKPQGVAADASGNIYIADLANNRIREVSGTTITTVAGITAPCTNPTANPACGDGGSAISAQLNNPFGVVVDIATNDIYIADTGDQRIRKVTASTAVISTVAGDGNAGYLGDNGPATSAWLDNPEGLAVDSRGNIYIADEQDNRVRAVGASQVSMAIIGSIGRYLVPFGGVAAQADVSSSVGFKKGDSVTVAGNSNSACNGTFTVAGTSHGGATDTVDFYAGVSCFDYGGTGGTITDNTTR